MTNKKINALKVRSSDSILKQEVFLPEDVDTVELFAALPVYYTKSGEAFPTRLIVQYYPTYKDAENGT